MKNTYVTKSVYIDTDWHDAHTESFTLLQENRPVITDVRSAIMADILGRIAPDAHAFVAECCDKKREASEDEPAVFRLPLSDEDKESSPQDLWEDAASTISCHWKDEKFHVVYSAGIYDYAVYYTYRILHIEEENTFFFPIASWYMGLKYGDTKEHLFRSEPFTSYDEALAFAKDIDEKYREKLKYDHIEVIVSSEDVMNGKWYTMQKQILDKTNGCSETFFENFASDNCKMYANLFGDEALKEFLKDNHSKSEISNEASERELSFLEDVSGQQVPFV